MPNSNSNEVTSQNEIEVLDVMDIDFGFSYDHYWLSLCLFKNVKYIETPLSPPSYSVLFYLFIYV